MGCKQDIEDILQQILRGSWCKKQNADKKPDACISPVVCIYNTSDVHQGYQANLDKIRLTVFHLLDYNLILEALVVQLK